MGLYWARACKKDFRRGVKGLPAKDKYANICTVFTSVHRTGGNPPKKPIPKELVIIADADVEVLYFNSDSYYGTSS